MKAKRATLSDANFEKLMFMKENDHHVETAEKEQEDKPCSSGLALVKLSQIPLRYLDRTSSEPDSVMEFGLSSSLLAAN